MVQIRILSFMIGRAAMPARGRCQTYHPTTWVVHWTMEERAPRPSGTLFQMSWVRRVHGGLARRSLALGWLSIGTVYDKALPLLNPERLTRRGGRDFFCWFAGAVN